MRRIDVENRARMERELEELQRLGILSKARPAGWDKPPLHGDDE